jgi:hypothetical protein
MLPPRSRFRSCQDRATGTRLPKNRNLTIFWAFYQASLRSEESSGYNQRGTGDDYCGRAHFSGAHPHILRNVMVYL